MGIRHFGNMLLKKLWLIILLPLIAGATAFGVEFYSYVPQYESSVTLLVINNDNQLGNNQLYDEILAGQQLVKEYKEIILSRAVTRTVLKELGINDLSSDGLALSTTVKLKEDTRILNITVRDSEPERAEKLANKLSEVFIIKAEELLKANNIEIVDAAEKPAGPIKPGYMKIVIIALLAGLMVAFGIVFILEELDDTIKSADDVESILGLKVLSTIPKLNKRGEK